MVVSTPASSEKKVKSSSITFPDKFYQDPYGLDRYVVQEKVLFEWRAPSKLERKRTRSDYFQIVLFFIILGLIILLLGEVLLLFVFIAGAFLYITTILSRPTFLQSQITTIGIKIEDTYYFWNQIPQFWFESKLHMRVLVFRHIGATIQNVRVAIQSQDEEEIRTTLGVYILNKKPTQSKFQIWTEKTRQSISNLFDFV